jgi:hypothetical protein
MKKEISFPYAARKVKSKKLTGQKMKLPVIRILEDL